MEPTALSPAVVSTDVPVERAVEAMDVVIEGGLLSPVPPSPPALKPDAPFLAPTPLPIQQPHKPETNAQPSETRDQDIATLLLALARPQTPPPDDEDTSSSGPPPPTVETAVVDPPSSASLASLLIPFNKATSHPSSSSSSFAAGPSVGRTIYSTDASHLPLSSEASSSKSRLLAPPPPPSSSSSAFAFPPPSSFQDGDDSDDDTGVKPPTSTAKGKPNPKRKRTSTSRAPANGRLSGDFPGKGKGKATPSASPADPTRSLPTNGSHILHPDSGLIRCICSNTDDDGFTIQCDTCYAWEHAVCMGIEEGAVPDDYLCELCFPREVDVPGARLKQRRRKMVEDQKARDELAAKPSSRGSNGQSAGSAKVNGGAPSPVEDGGLASPKDPLPTPGGGSSKQRRKPVINPATPLTPVAPPKSRKTNLLRDALQPPPLSTFPPPPSTASPQRPIIDIPPNGVYPSTPLPSSSTAAGAVSYPLANVEEDEDELSFESWTLEYTPIRDNVIRDPAIRDNLTSILEEWAGQGDPTGSGHEPPPTDGEDVDMDDPPRPDDPARTLPATQPHPLSSHPQGDSRTSEPPNHFPSAKAIRPPLSFSPLDPFLPPVHLSGSSLAALAGKTIVKPLDDASAVLSNAGNLSHPSLSSTSNLPVYLRPASYALFAEGAIAKGSFVGEYKGEILDAASYRRDPINQYRSLGVPKPCVRNLGPPLNLVMDARGFGNELRFVRSGCHPNVVLRPAIFSRTSPPPTATTATAQEDTDAIPRARQSSSSSNPASPTMPELIFGLFASKDISRRDEITLPWEWDDSHVVHALLPLLDLKSTPSLSHPSPLELAAEPLLPKFAAVLAHLTGTFATCACERKKDCAVFQMGRLVERKGLLGSVERSAGGGGSRGGGSRKVKKPELGLLVGAVRGWRRHEDDRATRLEDRRRAFERSVIEDRRTREAELLNDDPGSSEDDQDHGPASAVGSVAGAVDEDAPEPMVVDGEDDEDAANFSDASTLTEPLSHFSSDDDSSEDEARPRRRTVSTASSSASPPPALTVAAKQLPPPIRSPTRKPRTKAVHRRRVNNRVESVSPPSSPPPGASAPLPAPNGHLPQPPVPGSSQTEDIVMGHAVEPPAYLADSLVAPVEVAPVFDPWAVDLVDGPHASSAALIPQTGSPDPAPASTPAPASPTAPAREPTLPPSPPPKEPTPPPPKPLSPPPVVKRMSLKDWAKRRKETGPSEDSAVAPSAAILEQEGRLANDEEINKEGVGSGSMLGIETGPALSPSTLFPAPATSSQAPADSVPTAFADLARTVLPSAASTLFTSSAVPSSSFATLDRSPPRFAPIPRPAPPAPFVDFRRSTSPEEDREAAVPFKFQFNHPSPGPGPAAALASPPRQHAFARSDGVKADDREDETGGAEDEASPPGPTYEPMSPVLSSLDPLPPPPPAASVSLFAKTFVPAAGPSSSFRRGSRPVSPPPPPPPPHASNGDAAGVPATGPPPPAALPSASTASTSVPSSPAHSLSTGPSPNHNHPRGGAGYGPSGSGGRGPGPRMSFPPPTTTTTTARGGIAPSAAPAGPRTTNHTHHTGWAPPRGPRGFGGPFGGGGMVGRGGGGAAFAPRGPRSMGPSGVGLGGEGETGMGMGQQGNNGGGTGQAGGDTRPPLPVTIRENRERERSGGGGGGGGGVEGGGGGGAAGEPSGGGGGGVGGPPPGRGGGFRGRWGGGRGGGGGGGRGR